jgi:hypothetical protein
MPLRYKSSLLTSISAAAVLALALPGAANASLLSTKKATPTPTPTPAVTTTATKAAVTTVATPTAAVTSTKVPAATGCTQLPSAAAFSKVDGDQAQYSLAPGGDFESTKSSWTLTGGAKVMPGNETLGIQSGTHSLVMPLSSTATSPAFCVDQNNPTFRFAYKVDNAVLSGFIAYVIYRDANGTITNVQLISSKVLALSPSNWQASPASPLSTLIPLSATNKAATVQLKITSLNPTDFVNDTATAVIGSNPLVNAVTGIGGAASNLVGQVTSSVSPALNIGVTIDSVMVDPYRH